MLDISVAAAKERAARWAASWEPEMGPAGVEKTRRQPVALTDRQVRLVQKFQRLVPRQRRRAYRDAVEVRLSGSVGDAAVFVACVNAAADGFISDAVLAEQGLVGINSRGFVRPQHNERDPTWQSKAVMGTGR
jgi:hypothetical protein